MKKQKKAKPLETELKDLSDAYDRLFEKAEKVYGDDINALSAFVFGINALSGAILVERIEAKFKGDKE